ncbi:MAG: carbon monoxide dehydrogenase subunit G [Alicyclobacillus sp.]|nr:carbon monoxide dehydrogenase subunit G [Alicyclobacillus sp.]
MNGSGQVQLSGSVNEVWEALLDPAVLAQCMPGCEELEHTGEHRYRARLVVGVAAVKGSYSATMELVDVQPYQSYRLRIHGEGGPGFVDAEGLVQLQCTAEGTALHYTYTADVGGKVAAVGQRMLGGVAKLLVGDFFRRLQKAVDRQVQANRSAHLPAGG